MAPRDDQPLTIWQLCRELDARLVPTAPEGLTYACPGCGVQTPPSILGRRAYCLPCSEASCGEKLWALTRRVSHKLTRNQWAKLETSDDVPRLSYRTWRKRHFG